MAYYMPPIWGACEIDWRSVDPCLGVRSIIACLFEPIDSQNWNNSVRVKVLRILGVAFSRAYSRACSRTKLKLFQLRKNGEFGKGVK